jgi:hypothetical protein
MTYSQWLGITQSILAEVKENVKTVANGDVHIITLLATIWFPVQFIVALRRALT